MVKRKKLKEVIKNMKYSKLRNQFNKIKEMIKVKPLFVYLLLFTFYFSPLYAAGEYGKFMSWGAGARAMGLGNASIGIVDDAFSPYWNPAAMVRVQKKEIGTFHAILWEDTAYSYAGYVHPMLDKGAFGGSVVRLFTGGADKRDENNVSVGSFSNQNMAIGLSYANEFNKKASWGVSGKIISNSIDTHSQSGFTVDSAVLYEFNDSLSLGANFQNVISNTFGDTDDKLTPVLRIGSGYRVFGDKLLLVCDAGPVYEMSRFENYSVGIESTVRKIVKLRIGQNNNEFTAGFGLGIKMIKFDYAMAMHYLGSSHRVSFNMAFGRSLKEQRLAQAVIIEEIVTPGELSPEEQKKHEEIKDKFRETYQAAIQLYKKGLYTQSKDKFSSAQKIDPTDPDIPKYIKRLDLIVPIVPQTIAKDKTSELLRRAIEYFMEGKGEASVKTIAYALSTEPDNFTISRLLIRIEEETGFKADYKKPVTGMSIVEERLYESLVAFGNKEYSKVIDLCEDVLILEPDNVQAYKRLGSAFYALGDKRKAEENWKKALDLAPDKKLREMLDKMKSER